MKKKSIILKIAIFSTILLCSISHSEPTYKLSIVNNMNKCQEYSIVDEEDRGQTHGIILGKEDTSIEYQRTVKVTLPEGNYKLCITPCDSTSNMKCLPFKIDRYDHRIIDNGKIYIKYLEIIE